LLPRAGNELLFSPREGIFARCDSEREGWFYVRRDWLRLDDAFVLVEVYPCKQNREPGTPALLPEGIEGAGREEREARARSVREGKHQPADRNGDQDEGEKGNYDVLQALFWRPTAQESERDRNDERVPRHIRKVAHRLPLATLLVLPGEFIASTIYSFSPIEIA
jgi:hypothetical protein